jgi:hypothetical protein
VKIKGFLALRSFLSGNLGKFEEDQKTIAGGGNSSNMGSMNIHGLIYGKKAYIWIFYGINPEICSTYDPNRY